MALLGGAIEYSGAIRLASMALAALKSGAGLSTLAVPRFLVSLISENILEVMLYPMECNDKEIVYDKANVEGLIKKVDVLLLKGPISMVISKDREPIYIDRGTPGMATAGSGDVLSGIVTGFLGYMDDIFDASVVSAYINGMAGEYAASEMGEISMLSSDTVRMIPKAIREVMN